MIRTFFAVSTFLVLVGCGSRGGDVPTANVATGAATEHVAAPAKAPEPLPDIVRVRIETELGDIELAVDAKRAPITAGNFVRYVEAGRFDDTSFYRAAATEAAPGRGFIQGGIRRNYRRMFPPIAHEPTSETGLRHEAGTISMARTEPGNAMGEFFITLSAMPAMDAGDGEPGYAAFGRVTGGMDVAHRILAAPTVKNAGSGAMRGQMIAQPILIIRAVRID
jgi:peptidyl-prolyl cis-trans isomerase A (cyclophilin A)